MDLLEWFVLEALFSNESFSNELTLYKLEPLMGLVLNLSYCLSEKFLVSL